MLVFLIGAVFAYVCNNGCVYVFVLLRVCVITEAFGSVFLFSTITLSRHTSPSSCRRYQLCQSSSFGTPLDSLALCSLLLWQTYLGYSKRLQYPPG